MKSDALKVGVRKYIGFLCSFFALYIPFVVCDFEVAQ